MKFHEFAERVELLEPHNKPQDIAQLCLLLSQNVKSLDDFSDDTQLRSAFTTSRLKLNAAQDQHEAVMDELEVLVTSDPTKFRPEQIWVLVRAIKIQGQLLQLYLGDKVPAL